MQYIEWTPEHDAELNKIIDDVISASSTWIAEDEVIRRTSECVRQHHPDLSIAMAHREINRMAERAFAEASRKRYASPCIDPGSGGTPSESNGIGSGSADSGGSSSSSQGN